MIPMWVDIIVLYMVVDILIGEYFMYKYQGPYSDGKIHMFTPVYFLMIPLFLIDKYFWKSHIIEMPEGVYKVGWDQFKEIRKNMVIK